MSSPKKIYLLRDCAAGVFLSEALNYIRGQRGGGGRVLNQREKERGNRGDR
jgi:hypothetical protein